MFFSLKIAFFETYIEKTADRKYDDFRILPDSEKGLNGSHFKKK